MYDIDDPLQQINSVPYGIPRYHEQPVKEPPVRGEPYVWNIEDQTAYFLQSELEGQDTKHFT